MDFLNFIKKLIFEGNLFPKILLLFWCLLPVFLGLITYYDENNNKKQYNGNDIYNQWRKFN